ncbi:zinc-finger domain-containing protein [Paenalcaligenes niemegkensis]|uniref:zinc-finger domain-containing protein n=1 Tax=Paenalcaligenes niemegkensis TaxID=2895469 RepID=UPI001EE8BFCE|nr:zinc-finger domain-containing protein [Paenalcaligenes niemegkensis]MCQ9617104.1 zinc-finger domain-containing protein [Paenalcaligenes niemegkensis]
MSSASEKNVPQIDIIELSADDLPVYCPGPHAPLWSMHPRVYIDISKTGMGSCPYCSATYKLKEGEKLHSH